MLARGGLVWAAVVLLFAFRQYFNFGLWSALIIIGMGVAVVPVFVAITRRPDDGMRTYQLLAVAFCWATIALFSSVPFAHLSSTGTGKAHSRATTVESSVLSAAVTVLVVALLGVVWWRRRRATREALRRLEDYVPAEPSGPDPGL